MSKIVKKHDPKTAAGAFSIFFLCLLWALVVSIYPAWLRPVYGDVGAVCDVDNPAEACNLCDSETCEIFNPDSGEHRCRSADGSFETPSPVPFCPRTGELSCFRRCEVFQNNPNCLPDDTYCGEISGGNETNECRTAICNSDANANNNPTGCEYVSAPDAAPECVLCEIPAPTGAPLACGNGACEPDLGENAANCSIDCRVPGFSSPVPVDSSILDAACPDNMLASFDGPPWNVPDSGTCEDGDVCTNDVCNGVGECEITPKGCSLNVSDLCCAPSCAPPPPSGICEVDTNCDIDCYIPMECTAPSPTGDPTGNPTISPSPTPTFTLDPSLEGSGSKCSLSLAASSSSAMAWWMGGFGLLAFFGIRRRS